MITLIILCEITTLLVGVLSSVIGSVVVVFLLFFIFRPRINVKDTIAITKGNKLVFCIKNCSISSCINIHILAKQVKEHSNADESEYNLELAENKVLYLSGRFSKENDNEVGIITSQEVPKIPSHIRLIISAQHTVTGITSVTTKDFLTKDAQKGIFEKGLFIPVGSDYARVYMRKYLKMKKVISWLCVCFILILTAVYWAFFAESWQQVIICLTLLTCFAGTILLLWQGHVQTRATAFSSLGIISKINLMVIELGRRISNFPKNIEEIEADEDNHTKVND